MKTAAVLALVAVLLRADVAVAVPVPAPGPLPAKFRVTVDPARAAVGETITVGGPAGILSLESLEGSTPPVALGLLGAAGTIDVKVPDVPRGDYRVVVSGTSEAPVLTVVGLGQQTSVALLAFGFLFILVVLVAGVVIHRRWRDAVS